MKERTKTYTLAVAASRRAIARPETRVRGRCWRDRALRDERDRRQDSQRQKLGPRKRIIFRGGEGAARKVARDLSAVYRFAVRRGIVDSNPIQKAAIRRTDNRREWYLSLEEIVRLGRAFDEMAMEGANAKAIAIARLWALTGSRRDEIAGLKWSEVDFERSLLVWSESKTGKSIRPLGFAAIGLLRQIKRTDGSDYVFPAESGAGHYLGVKRLGQGS
ncbi:tyrosine-type recombinase/integrase [Dongia sedimenti]|uniref:Tyr recombinase domain-containing protein n=1 Tax=Dongia sedimenti TaxID=3064282 RepID=A0ABU0YPU4_9PROT|nr:hypothetical protein [Rhodospirillaceae bacterium R-7]